MGEMLKIIGRQYVPTNIEPIKAVFRRGREEDESSLLWALLKVYTYGVIMGKREERARRKRKTA